MPDYGHPIRFGTFVTPVHSPPQQAVALAQLSEQLGYDLVTFQDHPYNNAFHDTWTLISWVAARTERIQVSGNVLNLPLRPPAVLARAAASLDLLSDGRVALGLGAGGFWGPIAAMGGPERTIGEAVTALSEGIDVIRGIWDAGERAPLRVEGEHYRVVGAKRGPLPAHPIPIWLGAYKPRMLRLTGAKADGWLPSLPYMQPGDLARGNATIDAAARDAGRDPREVTRLLNVTGDLPAEEIARLALEDGISVFIVMGDDPGTLQRLAEDVIPTVRDAVAAERRTRGTSEEQPRPAAALAKRVDGIDYSGIPETLRAGAVEPGDFEYPNVAATYMRGGAPGLVLRPDGAAGVADAVRFADRHRHLPLGIRSAGHGISGRSTNRGGLVIDVGRLDRIDVVDPAEGIVRIGPGAHWADVARVLTPHGLAISSGDYGGVGVGGISTAGGIGWLAREHGLTIDHLLAVDVVLADGSLVRASPTDEPDLFWAMRGAGGNFGVAVDFEFRARPVDEVGFAQLVFQAGDPAQFIERWGSTMEVADRRVSGEFILGGRRPGSPSLAQGMLLVDATDPDDIVRMLQPFAEIAPLVDQSVAIAPYDRVMGLGYAPGPHQATGETVSRSGLAEHLTADLAAAAARLLDAGATHFFQVRAVGGAVADLPEDATAYGHRSANFSVVAMSGSDRRIDEHWPDLERHFEGMYLSFDTRQGEDVLAQAFTPATLTRLRELKRRYDPSRLFRDNFVIDPAAPAAGYDTPKAS